jgi:hypothetical protein
MKRFSGLLLLPLIASLAGCDDPSPASGSSHLQGIVDLSHSRLHFPRGKALIVQTRGSDWYVIRHAPSPDNGFTAWKIAAQAGGAAAPPVAEIKTVQRHGDHTLEMDGLSIPVRGHGEGFINVEVPRDPAVKAMGIASDNISHDLASLRAVLLKERDRARDERARKERREHIDKLLEEMGVVQPEEPGTP